MSERLDQDEIAVAYGRGRARWVGVVLDAVAFERDVRSRALDATGLARHGEDLFLAVACHTGDHVALDIFDRQYLQPSLPFLRRYSLDRDFAAEVLQVVRTKLLMGPNPRIAAYSGSGPLLAWVRICLARAAIDQIRSRRDGPLMLDIADQMLAEGASPETQVLQADGQTSLKESIERALKALSPRDRTLLRLHFLDGLGVDRIAPLFRIHRATVARRIAHLRRDLLLAVRRSMPGLVDGSAEWRSLWRLLGSNVQVSVDRLLRASLEGSPPEDEKGSGSSS